MKLAVVFLAAAASIRTISAQNLSKGFDHFYNLEYEQAIAEFERELREKPNEAERYNHLAQTLLYREMFKAGALESELVTGANAFTKRDKVGVAPAIEKRFFELIDRGAALAQAAIDANPKDARNTYALSVAHGLRGNWNFLIRKAYFDSLRDLTSSRKLANRVLEIDPAFIDAKMVTGVHDYVVGSLPAYVRMLGFLAGFSGDKDGGIGALQLVAQLGEANRVDARVLLGVIYRREKRPREAIPLLEDLTRRFPRNYLFRLETAQMWADLGDKEKALAAVDKVEELRKSGVTGYGSLSAGKVAYIRGNILFWYNDLDRAIDQLSKAAQAPSLDLHTGTMAWLRLGQTYDLKNQRPNALVAYRQVQTLAPDSDLAKESRRYLSSPYRREKS
ncbi:MAG: tetratricopeptide repeat protein [Bryobacteraceae bacterium]|nr:tetratricopeptide repeat protein [Bryobacteraceae bacterium]